LPNPVTGVVDIVQVTFDLRALQAESQMAQRNAMANGISMQTAMNAQALPQQEATIQQQ
tara:strand:+ start:438 stop:614 length:177 start_codon:yes stop_codon:yes gene_type:complete